MDEISGKCFKELGVRVGEGLDISSDAILPMLPEQGSSFCVHFLPTGDLKLEMPTVNLDREVTILATVPVVVQSLKRCAVTWQKLISRVLEEQLKKVPEVTLPVTSRCFYSWRLSFISPQELC